MLRIQEHLNSRKSHIKLPSQIDRGETDGLFLQNKLTPQTALSTNALAKHIYIADVIPPSTVYPKKSSLNILKSSLKKTHIQTNL